MNYLSVYAGYCDGAYLWTISNSVPVLLKIEVEKWEVVKVYLLPKWIEFTVFKQIFCVNNKLCCFPLEGSTILLFDLSTEKFDFVMDKENLSGYTNLAIKTGDVKEDDERLYLIPKNLNSPFYIIEKNSMKKYIHNEWTETVKKYIGGNKYKTTVSALWRGKLYTPVSGTDSIIIFDIEKNEVKIKRLELGENTLFALAESKYGIIINFLNSSQIAIWNVENNEIKFTCGIPVKAEITPYYRCIAVDEKIVVMPYIAKDIFVQLLNAETMKLCKSVKCSKEFKVLSKKGTTFYGFFISKGHLYLLPLRGNKLVDLELKSGEANTHVITCSDKATLYLSDLFGGNCDVLEKTVWEIYALLLKIDNHEDRDTQGVRKRYGELIWKNIAYNPELLI